MILLISQSSNDKKKIIIIRILLFDFCFFFAITYNNLYRIYYITVISVWCVFNFFFFNFKIFIICQFVNNYNFTTTDKNEDIS